MTLTEFLLARIAEDELTTRALLRRAREHELACRDPRLLGREMPGWFDWPKVQATATRVLTDCKSKRRIVARVSTNLDGFPWHQAVLAEVYADHPEYRQEWKP